MDKAKDKLLAEGNWHIRITFEVLGKKYGKETFERITDQEEVIKMERAIMDLRNKTYRV